MKKKWLLILFSIIALSSPVFAEIPKDKIAELSDAERTILKFTIDIVVANKNNGIAGEKYSPALDTDLYNFSISELCEIKDLLEAEVPVEYAEGEHIPFTVCDEVLSSEGRASFLFFKAVSDAGAELGLISQNNNPEVFLEEDNYISSAHLYLTYFGECTPEDARITLEHYTEELIYCLTNTFPDASIDILDVNWKIPAIDKDSLYAASYWCEKSDDTLEMGEGKGLIYQ